MEGCLGDPRGYAGRTYGGKFYRFWRLYRAEQISSFDAKKQEALTKKNLDAAICERDRLRALGYRVRMVKEDVDNLIVLFVRDDK